MRTLCLIFSLFSLVGCQSSRSISRANPPTPIQFASDQRPSTPDVEYAEATVLEESTAESASESSWSRIFNRFRSQPVDELPRTDIEENDEPKADAPVSFDSGF
jgi:hypothetical protein